MDYNDHCLQVISHSRDDKRRRKSKAIKEYRYDVPDNLYNRVRLTDCRESSSASLEVLESSQPGMVTFVMRGTRGQILEAIRMITTMTGAKEKEIEKAHKSWFNWIQDHFPHLKTHAYFIPPVFIRRMPVDKKHFAGQTVLMIRAEEPEDIDSGGSFQTSSATAPSKSCSTPSVQKSDINDDDALRNVLFTLEKFSKMQEEVFMCLSRFPFGSYLGEPLFAPAVAHLPLPSNLPVKYPWCWRQGDFDMLLIHRHLGFLICEVKSITINAETSNRQQVTKKLNAAVDQLNKAEAMLSHLVSDVAPDVRITKTIACPNLTSRDVQSIISEDQPLRETMSRCFKVNDFDDVSSLILCCDHLCSPENPQSDRDEKLQAFKQWWQKWFARSQTDSQFTTDLYRNVIARFCGPASTVTVPCVNKAGVCIKTLEQGVAHVGNCYGNLNTLLPKQVELLERAPPRVFMAGPPGTGRSTVLLQMATKWLKDNNNVHVLSTWDCSLAASYQLYFRLQETLNPKCTDLDLTGQVKLVKTNFRAKENIEKTLSDLSQIANSGPLYIIADEVGPDNTLEQNVFPEFCARLLECYRGQDDGLYFWAASCHNDLAPKKTEGDEITGWEFAQFDSPLRSPTSVISEIKKVVKRQPSQTIPEYSKCKVPAHSDGPQVKRFRHRPEEHLSPKIENCNFCGENIARFLCTELGISAASSDSVQLSTDESSTSARHTLSLQYKDVFILSRVDLQEDAPILNVLSEAGVPVKLMSSSESDIEDVVRGISDAVWVAREQMVRGLKRKVVVDLDSNEDSKVDYVEEQQRVMSRCTSQLVLVSLSGDDSD